MGCEYRMIMSRYDVCGLASSHGTTLHPRLPSSSFLSTRNVYPAVFLPQRSKSDFDSSQVIIWLALLEANFNEDKIDILIACAARYEGEMKERRKSENSNLKVDISKETWTNVWRI